MTNLELAKQQGNQAAPNVIDAAKASEVQIDTTLAQEQGNQATPLIADSLAGSESYDAIKQQGNQAMPLIADALVRPTPAGSPMYFEAAEANSTVYMFSTNVSAPNLEYSTDGVTWQEWQHITIEGMHTFDTLTFTEVGDRVYLRGDNPNGFGIRSGAKRLIYSHFKMTGKIAAGGNIMSLLDKDMEMTEIPASGFRYLFGDCTGENPNTSLIAAAAMPTVTVIGENGCENMYSCCTSLAAAADMPSLTTIGVEGCYGVYAGCTSLTAAAGMPLLTSIGDDGCDSMYKDCTFDMSDDETTLNFEFPTPPVTAGETTFSTAFDVAEWMGNTNGITNHYL